MHSSTLSRQAAGAADLEGASRFRMSCKVGWNKVGIVMCVKSYATSLNTEKHSDRRRPTPQSDNPGTCDCESTFWRNQGLSGHLGWQWKSLSIPLKKPGCFRTPGLTVGNIKHLTSWKNPNLSEHLGWQLKTSINFLNTSPNPTWPHTQPPKQIEGIMILTMSWATETAKAMCSQSLETILRIYLPFAITKITTLIYKGRLKATLDAVKTCVLHLFLFLQLILTGLVLGKIGTAWQHQN